MLALLVDKFSLSGPVWHLVEAVNDSFGSLGYLIIAIFAAIWLASITIYQIGGYDTVASRQK